MIPSITSAQRTNVNIDGDSSIVIEKVYAGLLSGPAYDIQSGKMSSTVSIRGAAAARWDLSSKLAIRSFGFADYDVSSQSAIGNAAFWAEYKPAKQWKISLGHGPSLTATNHRPHPATLSGHFEFFAMAQLPGVMTNVTAGYTPKNTTYAASVGLFQQKPVAMVGVSSKEWIGTLYYLATSHKLGGAITHNGKRLQTTLTYSHNDIASLALLYDCGHNIVVYASDGYQSTSGMQTATHGVGRVWKGKYNGLLALGYDAVDHQIKPYLMVTL